MRATVTAVASDADKLAIVTSHILSCEAYLFAAQPTGPADASGRKLALVGGTFTDDVARGYARGYVLTITDRIGDVIPGQWVRVRVGLTGSPGLYVLPSLMITSALTTDAGTQLTCGDVGMCLDELVYEADTTVAGTLRTLAAALTTGVGTLTRPVDVTQVPVSPIPSNTVGEFGHGRWDVLLSVADLLGIDLLWTDDGDLRGIMRTAAPPATSARIDGALVSGGQVERNRPVTRAVMLIARDKGLTELVGRAPTVGGLAGVTVADRADGDATTTQAQADALAAGLLARRTSERNVREVDTAPLPWLEAGVDVVELGGRRWWVRSVVIDLPSLATHLTLRDAT